ncbi:MAG TPA: SUMF1/EgtB/PvdO family nonheme iron enzyme [Kofleriaceae bacterium]
MKHVILFVAANPAGTDRLALDREARAIQHELERARSGDRFEFISRWAAEPLDLLRELRKLRPTVVHFSGHGERVANEPQRDVQARRDVSPVMGSDEPNGLCFQGPDGGAVMVSPEALCKTFRSAGPSVKLVVLNACYTASQAEALVGHVDCVLGMNGSIQDVAARSFAIGFYGGLGERESIAVAYQQGCAAIGLEGLRDDEHPQLVVRGGSDASQLVLAVMRPAGVGATSRVAAGLAIATAILAWLVFRVKPPPADMIGFPAVKFEMGSTPQEIQTAYQDCQSHRYRGCRRELFEREGPVRAVALSPFAIDRTEVTNQAFARWLSSASTVSDGELVRMNGSLLLNLDASELQRGNRSFEPRPGTERHPVIGVAPAGAQAYCAALDKRLPTEAEWEYAARGIERRRYPWGNSPEPEQLGCALQIGKVPGTNCPDPRPLADVASVAADVTPNGVHDLAGNASEWVADRFSDGYPDCGECRDPQVTEGENQVFRGGNRELDASVVRAAARSRAQARFAAYHTGFRCALSR